ncbi:hypothetical protein ACM26V_18720 [Salipaludibacillus sp. HK11]|uniref:hypothetical protein n=1 Tax=Salipaludibacillus sp. HK11 TaxID=3394320 RepID=UPI0039FCB4C1
MFKKIYTLWVQKKEEVMDTLQEEKGALSLEWVALGLLVIVFISAIVTYLQADGGNDIAERIIDTIGNLVEQIGSGGGGEG